MNRRALNRVGRQLTRVARLVERTGLGDRLRGRLRRSIRFAPADVDIARLGRESDGMRVAVISDVHLGFFFTAAEFVELAETVSAWSPDVICLVGDLVDERPDELPLLTSGLRALRAREAVLAVPGNHDYAASPDLAAFRDVMQDAGVTLLLNRGLRIRRGSGSMWFGGVDDRLCGMPDVGAALRGRHAGEPAILLSHHPDAFREAAAAQVDLTLSGHTHGGQITWFGRPLLPGSHFTRLGYWQGLHRIGESRLLVGRGAGVCALPIRVGVPPEVLMIQLRHAPHENSDRNGRVEPELLNVP